MDHLLLIVFPLKFNINSAIRYVRALEHVSSLRLYRQNFSCHCCQKEKSKTELMTKSERRPCKYYHSRAL